MQTCSGTTSYLTRLWQGPEFQPTSAWWNSWWDILSKYSSLLLEGQLPPPPLEVALRECDQPLECDAFWSSDPEFCFFFKKKNKGWWCKVKRCAQLLFSGGCFRCHFMVQKAVFKVGNRQNFTSNVNKKDTPLTTATAVIKSHFDKSILWQACYVSSQIQTEELYSFNLLIHLFPISLVRTESK